MAKSKCEEVSEWKDNPIPGLIRRRVKDTGFRIHKDEQCREYWLNEGERDYDLAFLTVSERNESGVFEIVYDSRCSPPQPASA